MNVTINDAINAFSLLRDHMKDKDYLWECYNLGISALKTIQDGNYQLSTANVSREILEEMTKFNCEGLICADCIYGVKNKKAGYYDCMSLKAKDILLLEQTMKEVEEWIYQNSTN